MVKQLVVDPSVVRKPSVLKLGEIPVNQYKRTVAEEVKAAQWLTADAAIEIYRDMALIREFESMLDAIKKLGTYEGMAYDHKGPAHLSVGQEAAAVGEAFFLRVEDHIFGSHRSHGEIIAKGMSAIRKLEPARLEKIMAEYHGGAILKIVETREPAGTTLERAVDFLAYGLLAEIFGREPGFNRGMGGSMHAFFVPFGVYPNNAIVGGSGDIAAGAALYKRIMEAPGMVIANIGDASSACGPVWEGLNFASMAQFHTLWPEKRRGGLPIVFAFMDNFYGMGGQPRGETMGFDHVARIGAALNPQNMHAETVDGNNPLAVADAIKRKRPLLESGQGPVLLDILTYRQSGHSPSDASSYRSREEIEMWKQADPLREYAESLKQAKLATEADIEKLNAYAKSKVVKAFKLATDGALSPRVDAIARPDELAKFMFSRAPQAPAVPLRPGDALKPLEENSRWKALAAKQRAGVAEGKPLPESKAVSYRDALFEAIVTEFYRDARLVAYGEENRDWDGAFGVYRGMTESFPYHRFFNAPISEGAIVGSAVGYALEGGRAIVELMYADFLGRAGDEVFNQLSKWQAMSGGDLPMPVIVRISVGSKYGAQHSQDWSALTAHIPGLKVIYPATPYDAKGLMAAALRGNDPVICFESQKTYGSTELFHAGGVPKDAYTIPIGVPEVKRPGKDLTILSFGPTLYCAIEAADALKKRFNIEAEVIDGRSIVPFDYEPVIDSLKKTNRLLVTSDACERGSFIANVAAYISQFAFNHLDAPVAMVGSRNWITPPAELENSFFPQASWLLDAIPASILPLSGYTPTTNRSAAELKRQAREGV
jgi:2-oxoisovalerate dehydrogenase E1 component